MLIIKLRSCARIFNNLRYFKLIYGHFERISWEFELISWLLAFSECFFVDFEFGLSINLTISLKNAYDAKINV